MSYMKFCRPTSRKYLSSRDVYILERQGLRGLQSMTWLTSGFPLGFWNNELDGELLAPLHLYTNMQVVSVRSQKWWLPFKQFSCSGNKPNSAMDCTHVQGCQIVRLHIKMCQARHQRMLSNQELSEYKSEFRLLQVQAYMMGLECWEKLQTSCLYMAECGIAIV